MMFTLIEWFLNLFSKPRQYKPGDIKHKRNVNWLDDDTGHRYEK